MFMAVTASEPERKRRKIRPRSERRQQLIDATIRCIAHYGLSSTTMQTVTREAGLSLGTANLHFDSKENLLNEMLLFVTNEYNEGLLAIMNSEGIASLAGRLSLLLDFQPGPSVTQRHKMAVWFAYYGEAGARPVYQKICSRRDRAAAQRFEALFDSIIADGGYENVDAKQLAIGYLSLIDGLWLALLIGPKDLSKAGARAVAQAFLHQAFPRHMA